MTISIAKNLAALAVFSVNKQCVIPEITGICAEDVAQNVVSAFIAEHIHSKPLCYTDAKGSSLRVYQADLERNAHSLVSDYLMNPPDVLPVDIITMAQDQMFDGNNTPDWESSLSYRQCSNIIDEGVNCMPEYKALLDDIDSMLLGALI
jgi:hypothetical protein